jgi:excisionase family DNA binding protein
MKERLQNLLSTASDMPPAVPPRSVPAKQAYSISEVCELSSLGRTYVYAAIKDRRLVAQKAGSRTLISHESLMNFLAMLPRTGER